jgi:hypothetical protein
MAGFIGPSLKLQSITTADTLNSSLTTSVWRMSMRNLSLLSESPTGLHIVSQILHLDLYSSWIHESTAFYNCHEALIEIAASKGSITVFHECVVSEIMC